MTGKESFEIMGMDECLDSLGRVRLFLTLKANSGYWKIEIDDQIQKRGLLRPMTAFTDLSNAVWSEEHTHHFSTRMGRYTTDREMVFRIGIPGLYFHLFKVLRETSGPHTDSTEFTVESWRINEIEKMILVRGLHPLSRPRDTARQTENTNKSD